MAKRLTRTVYVAGVGYGPSSVIPADVAKRITNPDVWVDDAGTEAPAPGVQDQAPAARPDGEPPSDGWTVKELRDYAKANGITLGEAKAKDAILAVLADHTAPAGDSEEAGDPGTESDGEGNDDADDADGEDDPEA